ncbi:MAG TPA: glycosyltransferase family 9 protein, partial [Tepidisphaeraceae bacterium]|nr:glycosyltransferase family 9 protein [Tepidisphaeraceae bacterium]
WAGTPEYVHDRQRTISPAALKPLGEVENVRFYSLQKGQKLGGGVTEAPIPMVDWADDLKDFADTAALITNLDLVIACDTAVAHLAGAMGRDVWTLLPFSPDWRWMLGRSDSPWYPTMRLFRQPKPGDWGAVIEEVKMELRKKGVVDA